MIVYLEMCEVKFWGTTTCINIDDNGRRRETSKGDNQVKMTHGADLGAYSKEYSLFKFTKGPSFKKETSSFPEIIITPKEARDMPDVASKGERATSNERSYVGETGESVPHSI